MKRTAPLLLLLLRARAPLLVVQYQHSGRVGFQAPQAGHRLLSVRQEQPACSHQCQAAGRSHSLSAASGAMRSADDDVLVEPHAAEE